MTSNPRNIEWPQDATGFLYKFKHTGVQAAERQMANAEKHEAFMGTLRALAKHAKARYELQVSLREAAKAEAAAGAEIDAQLDLDFAAPKDDQIGPEAVPAPALEAPEAVDKLAETTVAEPELKPELKPEQSAA